jgi:DNA-binding MarR family transcriptional regulator
MPSRALDTQRSLDAVRRLVRALRLASRETEAAVGMSAAQLFVLAQLADSPASSFTALGARTHTDRSSVAAVVERLAARGLVRCTPAPDDRRRTAVAITATGRALLRRAPQAPAMRMLDALERMSDAELRQLAESLTQFTEQMGVATEPATMLFEDAETPRRVSSARLARAERADHESSRTQSSSTRARRA